MRENAQRFDCARLHPTPPGIKRGIISVCGFGPSLADTWREIKGRVMTTSGAHDFLIGKGVIPKYHVETDPREHKVNFVRNSHPDVTYLINSQCHPKMFEMLLAAGRRVLMWHGFTDDDAEAQIALMESLEPGARLMAGGTNAGMRAIVAARELGYTRFYLHGMDCCYRGEEQWAGEHFTKKCYPVKIEVEGRVFETSEQMMQSTDDFFNTLHMLSGCSFKIYGDGLLEARMQMFMRDRDKALNWGWWKPVDFALKKLIIERPLPDAEPKLRRSA
jgi:hypothetical protein